MLHVRFFSFLQTMRHATLHSSASPVFCPWGRRRWIPRASDPLLNVQSPHLLMCSRWVNGDHSFLKMRVNEQYYRMGKPEGHSLLAQQKKFVSHNRILSMSDLHITRWNFVVLCGTDISMEYILGHDVLLVFIIFNQLWRYIPWVCMGWSFAGEHQDRWWNEEWVSQDLEVFGFTKQVWKRTIFELNGTWADGCRQTVKLEIPSPWTWLAQVVSIEVVG